MRIDPHKHDVPRLLCDPSGKEVGSCPLARATESTSAAKQIAASVIPVTKGALDTEASLELQRTKAGPTKSVE